MSPTIFFPLFMQHNFTINISVVMRAECVTIKYSYVQHQIFRGRMKYKNNRKSSDRSRLKKKTWNNIRFLPMATSLLGRGRKARKKVKWLDRAMCVCVLEISSKKPLYNILIATLFAWHQNHKSMWENLNLWLLFLVAVIFIFYWLVDLFSLSLSFSFVFTSEAMALRWEHFVANQIVDILCFSVSIKRNSESSIPFELKM